MVSIIIKRKLVILDKSEKKKCQNSKHATKQNFLHVVSDVRRKSDSCVKVLLVTLQKPSEIMKAKLLKIVTVM